MFRRLIVLASIFLVAGSSMSSVFAQQAGGSGLQISPTRTEISAMPGEQKTFSIIVTNVTAGDLVAKAVLNDFESDGQTGNPKIIVDTKTRSPYSINSMLKGLQDVDLKAKEKKEVKLTIDVPANATPGGYFGAVRFIALPQGSSLSDDEQRVALQASVAHLVLVEVPGDINEQLQIEKLTVSQNDKAKSFFFKAPNKASVTVKNLGNGFSRPFGRVSVTKGGKEVYGYEVNDTNPKGIVLPNTSRAFTDKIDHIKTPGKYTVTAAIAYGSGSGVINSSITFWYVPAWVFVAIFAILIVLIVGGYLIYRRRFSSKRKRV